MSLLQLLLSLLSVAMGDVALVDDVVVVVVVVVEDVAMGLVAVPQGAVAVRCGVAFYDDVFLSIDGCCEYCNHK